MNATDNRRDRPSPPPIGLLLRTLDSLINEQFERTLGARGITRRQWQLLATLAERPATLDTLNAAVAPFLDQAAGETARRHLDPLVEQGAVAVTDDVYELVDAGRTLFDRLVGEVQVTRQRAVEGLSDGDYERTIATLQTMIDNLRPSSSTGGVGRPVVRTGAHGGADHPPPDRFAGRRPQHGARISQLR